MQESNLSTPPCAMMATNLRNHGQCCFDSTHLVRLPSNLCFVTEAQVPNGCTMDMYRTSTLLSLCQMQGGPASYAYATDTVLVRYSASARCREGQIAYAYAIEYSISTLLSLCQIHRKAR